MKLNNKEKDFLLNYGCIQKDIQQIEKTKIEYIYIDGLKEIKISLKEAKTKINIEDFLIGIARASFHGSSIRNIKENKYLYFLKKEA